MQQHLLCHSLSLHGEPKWPPSGSADDMVRKTRLQTVCELKQAAADSADTVLQTYWTPSAAPDGVAEQPAGDASGAGGTAQADAANAECPADPLWASHGPQLADLLALHISKSAKPHGVLKQLAEGPLAAQEDSSSASRKASMAVSPYPSLSASTYHVWYRCADCLPFYHVLLACWANSSS